VIIKRKNMKTINTKNKLSIIVGCLVAILCVSNVQALIVIQADYHLGESGLSIDSSVNGRNFTSVAVTATTGTLNPISAINPNGNSYTTSTTYYAGNSFIRDIGYQLPNNNFGVELYARTAVLSSGFGSLFSNAGGNNGRGFELYYDGGNFLGNGAGFGGALAGVAFVGNPYNPASISEWVHLALVRDNGTTTFYVNGIQNGLTTTSAPIAVNIGDVIDLGSRNGTGAFFDGAIDEVRLFTFTSGQFSTSDLLFNTVPEPTTTSALFLSILLLTIFACIKRSKVVKRGS
jgi:hypothetical protein